MRLVMFPGQGSQYPGMGKDWFENFAEAKLAFEEASDGSGLKLRKLCFEGSETDLKATEITQPAILTTTIAIFRSLAAHYDLGSIEKGSTLFAGHSLGEYSALVAMGTLNLGEAARLVNHRGKYMQEAVPAGTGGMSALVFKPKTDGAPLALSLCEEASRKSGKPVSVANFNSPEQVVVAGHMLALAAVEALSKDERFGVRKVVPLPVSAPFHSSLMKPAAERLAPELGEAKFSRCPNLAYVANVDAQTHDVDAGLKALPERLITQITSSVRWVESIQAALSAGCDRAVEIGPGKVLAGLVKRIPLQDKSLEASNIDRLEDFKNASQRI